VTQGSQEVKLSRGKSRVGIDVDRQAGGVTSLSGRVESVKASKVPR